jgi:glucan-binding YG repeat protein
MAEQEGTSRKAATIKKPAAPKAAKTNAEAATEAKPKAPVKARKTAEPKKALASVTRIDVNREPTTAHVSPTRISTEQIARLAHQYWLERGCKHGHDAEDWFRAEQELRSKAS